MKPKAFALVIGLIVALVSPPVFADVDLPNGHVRLTTGPGELIGPNGQRYYLPVGTHILDEITYKKLDDEIKDLQGQVTRYKAENESLKRAVTESGPGWGTAIVLGTLTLIAGGSYWYVHTH
jgi:hypothetical protein